MSGTFRYGSGLHISGSLNFNLDLEDSRLIGAGRILSSHHLCTCRLSRKGRHSDLLPPLKPNKVFSHLSIRHTRHRLELHDRISLGPHISMQSDSESMGPIGCRDLHSECQIIYGK